MKKLITFEGIEGSGKSTQIKLVAEYLIEKNVELLITQEPSGTNIGRKIGGILFNREHYYMCAETEMFLFCAARAINDYSSMLLKPDLTLLFDLPVEIGLQRATERNNCLKESSSIDRFERENMDFHRRIREGYLNILKNEPNRFRLIDATRDVDTIQEEVRRYIVDFINLQN